MGQDLPLCLAAAAPGIAVMAAGIVGVLRAPKDDRAARRRWGRLNATGYGLFVLGLALALAWVGIAHQAWVLVLFAVVVIAPQVVVFFRLGRRMGLADENAS